MQITKILRAEYLTEVYLLQNTKSGKAGQIIWTQPGYARNHLIPSGKGILMGEGEFRKVLPVLHQSTQTMKKKLSVKDLLEERDRLLNLPLQEWKPSSI